MTNIKHTVYRTVIQSATIEKPSYEYLKSVTVYMLHPEVPNSLEALIRQQQRIKEGETTPESQTRK